MATATIWRDIAVRSPNISVSVPVIAATGIPYLKDGNRLQTFTICLPKTADNAKLLGQPATALPSSSYGAKTPRYHVHIHGGAWRDPLLFSRSLEATVAHAFSDEARQIEAIISINYTLSPFPTHPTEPYDPWTDNDPSKIQIADADRDYSREARHPMHVRDALTAFAALREFGLKDDNYILSGHSCGACIAFQTVLQPPTYWRLADVPTPPRPAALIGMNGLFDLPALVYDLTPSHERLSGVYRDLQSVAFGIDEEVWAKASPALFDVAPPTSDGSSVPKIVLVDQSTGDQLVPTNQMVHMRANLERAGGIRVVTGSRCVGEHAAPWKEGHIIWDTVKDVLDILEGLK